MAYAQYLRALLQPLGVYDLSEHSFSGAEVEALGAAMDALWERARRAQRESIAASAEEEGLTELERLLPYCPAAADTAARRAAIGAFCTIGGDSFTLSALRRSLAACGLAAELRETETAGTVAVSFPGVMGRPDQCARVYEIIEAILPCHLEVRYELRWCTWGEAAVLSWGGAGGMSWGQLQKYRA